MVSSAATPSTEIKVCFSLLSSKWDQKQKRSSNYSVIQELTKDSLENVCPEGTLCAISFIRSGDLGRCLVTRLLRKHLYG